MRFFVVFFLYLILTNWVVENFQWDVKMLVVYFVKWYINPCRLFNAIFCTYNFIFINKAVKVIFIIFMCINIMREIISINCFSWYSWPTSSTYKIKRLKCWFAKRAIWRIHSGLNHISTRAWHNQASPTIHLA